MCKVDIVRIGTYIEQCVSLVFLFWGEVGKFCSRRVVPRERVRSPKFESRRGKLLRDGCACTAHVKLGMRNVRRVHVTDIWSWYRVELRVGDHLGRSEELVSWCVECDLAEPESLASLGGSAPGVVDGILSTGVHAVKAELQQLHDLKVMEAKPLSPSQKREALGYLMFLKRKRSGKVKARGCADGRPQRAYIPQEDAWAPTVSTEAVFMMAVIDAMENRMVAVVDIPGAFMQADMDPGVYMRIDGAMAEMLMEIDYDMYQPHMVTEKGKPVIYVELLKALYGTLRAARLFWETLSRKLQEWGFTLNPYDSCVANKEIEGQQCTIMWHVDDLKISHVEEHVVRSIIQKIKDAFGQHSELSMHIGKRHDYLGMILNFTTPGALEIDMSDYIQVILQDAPANLRGTSTVPAAKHLFKTRHDAPKLNPSEQEMFHHLTMQLMYLSQPGRPDIHTAVAFLSSRVSSPDQDDYSKLGKVIKCLENMIHLTLRLQMDKSNILQWWVDAAYANHPDMKGQTGATCTMGHGSVYSNSLKQKIVARSSTEAELIGVHDILPQILWTRNFLIAQGYPVQRNIVYQDNMSTILLENNGRKSSTKRTKHIEMRYFFIHDQVIQEKVLIQHCPTDHMRADFFTKPLQGMLFYRLRDLIMNIAPESPYHSSHRSVLRHTAEGCDKQHDNPAGEIHDISAGVNEDEDMTPTHTTYIRDDSMCVKDGESGDAHTQQATSHNSNQFSVNHT